MIETLQLRVTPREASEELTLKTITSSRLAIDVNRIKDIIVTKKSIDARQRNIFINLTVRAYVDEAAPANPFFTPVTYGNVADKPKVIVVGAGPAGLFAALRLIEHGLCPIVLERGKNVDERRLDMAQLARQGVVDPDSNYCFGEGGAGAFSDGKLYTRSKKRGSVDKVLETFCQFGASADILIDAHPHIGTDKLPGVIRNIRTQIETSGGEVHFNTRVTELLTDGDNVTGVMTADGTIYNGPVILAIGHSARDTYRNLTTQGVTVQPKGIAIGVRLEHPQQLIDRIRYHRPEGRGKYLPAAEYSFVTQADGRGVYSFCMCPGGVIIPSASGPQQQAVNGMSPSNRGTKWANSGMVVEVLPEDLTEYDNHGVLKVLAFQEDVEKRFFVESGSSQNAPAQRMKDFVEGKTSADLPSSSYAPGIHSARVDNILPPFVSGRLKKGFVDFGNKQRGFLTNEATVIGCETRTSAPLRLVRDDETLQSLSHKDLYPVGEGAGYAGGIVSAAIDGQRAADAIAATLIAPTA